jgi:hypothetical protein
MGLIKRYDPSNFGFLLHENPKTDVEETAGRVG